MTKILGGPLETLERKELAIILRGLLDRYPVIVVGDTDESIDFIAESLINLVPHRREVVFGSDFISNSEHEQMIAYEKTDYNGERMVYRAPSSVVLGITQEIRNFKGWVIAAYKTMFDNLIEKIKSQTPSTIILELHNGTLTLKLGGNTKGLTETSFEQKLFEKVMSETQMKIERITRVLKRAAQGKVSERLEKSLTDLQNEEERVRQSLFREQIQAFVHAAWRTLVILLRLRLLEEVGVKSVISDKTLRQAIDYKGASINRLMEFIIAEWGEDFAGAIEGGRKRNFGDRLEGSWAV